METLREHLDRDTSLLIFEFLINGREYHRTDELEIPSDVDNYNSFSLEEIKSLRVKIYRWDECRKWAAKKGNFEITKYADEQEGESDDVWEECIYLASEGGNIEIIEYFASKACFSRSECLSSAAEGGHFEVVKYLENRFNNESFQREDDKIRWEGCIIGSLKGRHPEIVKYAAERSGENDDPKWNHYMRVGAFEGRLDIVQYCEEKNNELKEENEWNKCMKVAAGGGNPEVKVSDYLEIVKYIGSKVTEDNSIASSTHDRVATVWETCLYYAEAYDNSEIIEYAKSKMQ